MNKVLSVFKNVNKTKEGLVPKGTPFDVYSKRADYIRVTNRPESFKSYREFLMVLTRFVWVIDSEKENLLIRRAQMAHGMDTVLTRNPFGEDEDMEQHVPSVPDWI